LAGKMTRGRKIFWAVTGFFFVMFLIQGVDDKPGTATLATVEAEPPVTAPLAEAISPVPVQVSAEEERIAAAEEATAAEEAAHDQKYGFTCLSLWDGSHERFVDAVKDAINDPDSFEHDETRTWPVNAEGRNTIVMNFRARNALGGMVRVKAAGSFDNVSCGNVRIDVME
jgi:hypothetical protein